MAGLFRRVILPLTAVAFTVAGLVNTYGDSSGVEKLAGQTACGGTPCPTRMTEFERSAFSQQYVFAVGKNGQSVAIHCARRAIFFGDYHCEKK